MLQHDRSLDPGFYRRARGRRACEDVHARPTRGGSRAPSDPLALRHVLRFAPRSVPALVDFVSLRRPEVIVRRTQYAGLVVDERILSRVFPWVPRAPTMQAVVLLSGRMRLETRDGSSCLDVRPGEVALLGPADTTLALYEDATLLDLKWAPSFPIDGPALRPLASIDLASATALAARLALGTASHAEIFEDAFVLFRSAGAPLGALSVDTLAGGPSDQDERIARAITAQVADIRTSATALSFGEHAELSPRHIQRVLTSFGERYRMDATGWRDMRNRYRLQFAIALASVPRIPISTLADEVGYASSTALARAFANAGLPSPRDLREHLRAGAAR